MILVKAKTLITARNHIKINIYYLQNTFINDVIEPLRVTFNRRLFG